MRLPFQLILSIVFACLVGAAFAASPPQGEAPALLPQAFGGWQMEGTPRTGSDPAVADASNARVLQEYRFTDLTAATYTREDGRTLKIRAARFSDASGAFGAYTFYLRPDMNKEQIGDQGSSVGDRVLFYRGHVLVDAQFSRRSEEHTSELQSPCNLVCRLLLENKKC